MSNSQLSLDTVICTHNNSALLDRVLATMGRDMEDTVDGCSRTARLVEVCQAKAS